MKTVTGVIARKVTEAQTIPVAATYANHGGLSATQKEALLSCRTNRQGATPAPITSKETLRELIALGYLGKSNGLTRHGSITRQILVEDQMNELFG